MKMMYIISENDGGGGAKPQRAPKAFEQTSQGFEHFQSHLLSCGIKPGAVLIVREATGSYWVALATTLVQAGFAVRVIHPAQAHSLGWRT